MTEFDNDWEYQGKRKDQLENSPLAFIIVGALLLIVAFIFIVKTLFIHKP